MVSYQGGFYSQGILFSVHFLNATKKTLILLVHSDSSHLILIYVLLSLLIFAPDVSCEITSGLVHSSSRKSFKAFFKKLYIFIVHSAGYIHENIQ